MFIHSAPPAAGRDKVPYFWPISQQSGRHQLSKVGDGFDRPWTAATPSPMLQDGHAQHAQHAPGMRYFQAEMKDTGLVRHSWFQHTFRHFNFTHNGTYGD